MAVRRQLHDARDAHEDIVPIPVAGWVQEAGKRGGVSRVQKRNREGALLLALRDSLHTFRSQLQG